MGNKSSAMRCIKECAFKLNCGNIVNEYMNLQSLYSEFKGIQMRNLAIHKTGIFNWGVFKFEEGNEQR